MHHQGGRPVRGYLLQRHPQKNAVRGGKDLWNVSVGGIANQVYEIKERFVLVVDWSRAVERPELCLNAAAHGGDVLNVEGCFNAFWLKNEKEREYILYYECTSAMQMESGRHLMLFFFCLGATLMIYLAIVRQKP